MRKTYIHFASLLFSQDCSTGLGRPSKWVTSFQLCIFCAVFPTAEHLNLKRPHQRNQNKRKCATQPHMCVCTRCIWVESCSAKSLSPKLTTTNYSLYFPSFKVFFIFMTFSFDALKVNLIKSIAILGKRKSLSLLWSSVQLVPLLLSSMNQYENIPTFKNIYFYCFFCHDSIRTPGLKISHTQRQRSYILQERQVSEP